MTELKPNFLYRIPGRDYRYQVTHKLPSEMTPAERQSVERNQATRVRP